MTSSPSSLENKYALLDSQDDADAMLWTGQTATRGSGTVRRIGFNCVIALIFLRFSFLSELIKYLTGHEFYLLYIFGVPALFAFVSTGGIQRSWRATAPKFWLGLVVCMCLSVPFSIWQGDSLQLAVAYIRTVFLLHLFTVGLTVRWTECRKMIYAVAGAAAFDVVVALFFMHSGEERFSFDWSGMIGNSNDFAAHLLLTVPFLVFPAFRSGTGRVTRTLVVIVGIIGLFEILRTASRGAFIALVVTIACLMLRGSARQKLVIGVASGVVVIAMIAYLPSSTWNRMMSFSSSSRAGSAEASESRDIRTRLLQDSVKCTLSHPLLGVGLGQFGFYESGVRGHSLLVSWRPTHNSYTEISSECGIPAVMFYFAAVIWTFRLLSRTGRQASGAHASEMRVATYAITMGMIAFSVAIFFLNFGYTFQVPVVSALVESMWRVARDHPEAGS